MLAFYESIHRRRRHSLLRIFSLNYPDGRAGIGLLLLRATLGLTAMVQGKIYLFNLDQPTIEMRALGFLAIACGITLLLGLLTPFASLLLGLGSIIIASSRFPENIKYLLNDRISNFFLLTMAAALVLLGAGAFSLDARLFGRREIFIPQTPREPES